LMVSEETGGCVSDAMLEHKVDDIQVSLMFPLVSQVFSLRLVRRSTETGLRPGIAVAAADARRVVEMRLM
jgi:tRNA nucleotidyltransferase/poly(A) polymerase